MMRLIKEFEAAFPIRIEQSESGMRLFKVTYGKQVRSQLTYADAAREFGQCMFHAMACDGLLDNNGV